MTGETPASVEASDRSVFLRLLDLPLDELLAMAAERLVDVPVGSDDDPSGEWTANGGQLTVAENQNAIEVITIYATKRSTVAVYESRYKGVIGQVIRPSDTWAISRDVDGSLYYWSHARHGDTAGLFALAGTDCDDLPPDSLLEALMRWYISAGLYRHLDPKFAAELLPGSTIPVLNLKQVLGIVAL